MNEYRNSLGEEMKQYLEFLEKAGRYTKTITSLFRELDCYIPANVEKENCLSKDVIFEWDKNLSCSPVTRKRKYTELRGFIRFLQTAGIKCYIPETPRKPSSTYVPYIFDENEWDRIIMEADNLADSLKRTGSDIPIVFPMLVRILYVCGLRVSEALSLKVGDVDFTQNCLNIQKAKRKRQRLVPIKESTADLLRKYLTRRGILTMTEAYVFACENGNPPSQSRVQRWFAVTLKNSEIHQVRQHPGERGICPHCIRHTFAFRSFQNSGDTFENMVPFLSIYLGHENIMETDRYLRFSYELYNDAHDKISEYTKGVFPEVIK